MDQFYEILLQISDISIYFFYEILYYFELLKRADLPVCQRIVRSRNIPYGFSLGFYALCGSLNLFEISIRSRTFLFLCITQLMQERAYIESIIGKVIYDVITLYLLLRVLLWSKDKITALAGNVFILMMSYVVNKAALSTFIGIGEFDTGISFIGKSRSFLKLYYKFVLQEYLPAMQLDSLCYETWKAYNQYDPYHITPVLITFQAVQGTFARRLAHRCLENPIKWEIFAIQLTLGLPLLIGIVVTTLPYLGTPLLIENILFTGLVFPAILTLGYVTSIGNPFCSMDFRVPFEMYSSLSREFGWKFTIAYIHRSMRVYCKQMFIENESLSALKIYWILHCITNMYDEIYYGDETNVFEAFSQTFCQDLVSVIASAAIVSSFIRILDKVIASKCEVTDITIALGVLPIGYLFLQSLNELTLIFSCGSYSKADYLSLIIFFIGICYIRLASVIVWKSSIKSIHFKSFWKHKKYLVTLTLLTAMPILILHISDGTMEHTQYYTVEKFMYEITTVNIIALVSLLYSFKKSSTFDSTEHESHLHDLYWFNGILELFVAFYFFICGPPRTKGEHGLLASGMSTINLLLVILKFDFAATQFRLFRMFRNILSSSQIVKKCEIPGLFDCCELCGDSITEDEIVTQCFHNFHYFCFREWVRDVGPECPECRRNLMKCFGDNSSVDLIEDNLDYYRISIRNNEKTMKKFDASISFFNNLKDLQKESHLKFNVHFDIPITTEVCTRRRHVVRSIMNCTAEDKIKSTIEAGVLFKKETKSTDDEPPEINLYRESETSKPKKFPSKQEQLESCQRLTGAVPQKRFNNNRHKKCVDTFLFKKTSSTQSLNLTKKEELNSVKDEPSTRSLDNDEAEAFQVLLKSEGQREV